MENLEIKAHKLLASVDCIEVSQLLYLATEMMKTPEQLYQEAYEATCKMLKEDIKILDSGNWLIINGDKQMFIYFVLQRGSYVEGEKDSLPDGGLTVASNEISK